MRANYSVKQVAQLSGISIRTLHLYDEMELLRPAFRAESGYRYYGEKELLRLQQVLFYKEMGLPLKEIALILDDADFDLLEALANHRKQLLLRKARLAALVKTIDKTIYSLKNKSMINAEELYEGMPAALAAQYREEAVTDYGEEVVERAEVHLKKLDKEAVKGLVARQKELAAELFLLMGENPGSEKVQQMVHCHYENTRKLWGTNGAIDKQAEAYKGLGLLYLTDERFTLIDNEYHREFAEFLSRAMTVYAENRLT